MTLTVISSGSDANGYILTDNNGQSLLIEAGCSLKKVKEVLNFDISKVVAMCVSHSHL